MLVKSSQNILIDLNNNSYLIINLLYGHADVLDEDEYKKYLNNEPISEFIEKGYLVDPEKEKLLYNKKYLEFLSYRETEEIQLFFVPDYSCNFDCSYCYQKDYQNPSNKYNKSVIDAFFSFINNHFYSRDKYITLFGGEPLLMSDLHKDYIYYFLKKSCNYNVDIAIVTNGYYLLEYIPIFKKSGVNIREIQVTLDGIEEIHNSRRKLKGGQGTFKKIVEGIDIAIKEGYTINLRIVVDSENIEKLHEFASFAIEKGWTDYSKFKTQIGRNYELHTCTFDPKKLFTREKLYENLVKLILKYPEILKLHKPDFFVLRDLKEKGKLPEPVFDVCPATKSEWAFDYTGKIYPCTATVGKIGEELGMFYPEVHLNFEDIEKWNDRDVLAIDECKNCNLQLLCGGGCAALAKNKSGDIFKPDCRPVESIIQKGFSIYFKEKE